ncbi:MULTISPECIES: phosphatase PAP2 family protein [Actinomadura]|uniref:Phosphatase PAP2 family protein n=1 Tax=Actinomadura yumaensis TaxID=111807 RepID=A0ABW2CRY9_9ACTN|nr:phosphatase PAP2 family protein [Actinomadura sp. J1-007]
MRRSADSGAMPWTGRRLLALLASAGLQVALMATLLGLYGYGRHLADGRPDEAFGNARRLWDLERTLGLPDESSFQRWALGWDRWVRIANEYYVRVHFPASVLFMAWVWFLRRRAWPRVRAIVVGSAAVALLVHFLYPLAPPRMLSGHGLVDLMTVYGPSAYANEPGQGMSNQFAAMPSLHVGWALMVAWGVVRYGRGRWRHLIVLHPVVTLLVVVLTANHYWLDGAVGAAIVLGCVAATAHLPAHRDGEGRDGAGHDGAGHDGAAHDGAAHDGAGRDGAALDGAGHDGAGHDGAACDGAVHDRAVHDRAGRDGTGHGGTGRDGDDRDGAGRDGGDRDGAGCDGGRPGMSARRDSVGE